MKTLNWYIMKNIAFSALLALGVLTFVMLSGQLYQAGDLLSRGVSPSFMGRFLLYLMPDMLRFTLPLSVLIATVLVFSRMSSDNEIVAMKSMGVSLWQIVSPALFLSFLLSGFCLWLSLQVAPKLRYRSNQLWWEATNETPVALLEPGSFSELFPGCSIRIGARKGEDLVDVHIVLRDKNGENVQDIAAKRGRVAFNQIEKILELELDEAQINSLKMDGKQDQSHLNFLSAKSIRIPLDTESSRSKHKLTRKYKFMDVRMLCAKIELERKQGQDVTEPLLNLHKRLALSLSPFSFLLLGLPFGIRSKRSELSVGLLICVLLALGFYAFMLLADALQKFSGLHPQYIIWIPNLLYQVAGVYMLRRLEHGG